MENNSIKANGKALIPFLVFIVVYLGSGTYLSLKGVSMAFYQFPAPVAVFMGVVTAFIMFKGNINDKFSSFVKGCGHEDIIVMCTIYLLAGAFAAVSRSMGGVESTVNLGLTFIPAKFITAGLFIIAAFISISTGTSCGSLAAVAPIAIGLADSAGLGLAITLAAVVGGAMFGDNLSIISDTTIAATRTQGCEMRDKFKVNIFIAMPAAILTVVLLVIFGSPITAVEVQSFDYNLIKVLPYVFVLVLAIAGLNVFVVLTGGIVLSGIIGIAYGDLTPLTMAQETFNGFASMNDIFLVSMLTGGLAHMVTKEGGLEFLIQKIKSKIKGRKSAEIGIAAMVSVTDMAIANNTVSIIIDGPIAREIAEEYHVDPRRSASLLDTFACITQGMIPYGAQMLMVSSFTAGAVTAIDVMPLLWYQQLLAVSAILSIFIPFADGIIKKNPWNWEKKEQQAN